MSTRRFSAPGKAKRLVTIGRQHAALGGHIMKPAKWLQTRGSTVCIAECRNCDDWFMADTLPEPNGIDLAGPAIVTICTGRRYD